MPTYDAVCGPCGVTAEYLRPVAECLDTPCCPECGKRMKKVILTAPTSFVSGKFEPFRSTVDGSLITTQRELQQHNDRNHVVCLSDGYDESTIQSGDFGKKESVLDKKELVADLQESIHKVSQGYRPIVEVQND